MLVATKGGSAMQVSGTSSCVDVIVSLDELEDTMLLLTAHGSLLSPNYKRWRTFSATIGRSFTTKGHLVITLAPKDHVDLGVGAKSTLHDAPQECRVRVRGILSFYVPVGMDLATCDVTLIAG